MEKANAVVVFVGGARWSILFYPSSGRMRMMFGGLFCVRFSRRKTTQCCTMSRSQCPFCARCVGGCVRVAVVFSSSTFLRLRP